MKCKIKPIFLLLMFALCIYKKTNAQGSLTSRTVAAHKATSKVAVDGLLEENDWRTAAVADSFINKWPTDSGKAKLQTEVRILYDESFIYFGIRAETSDKDLVIQSLKRDINPYYSDGVSVVLDPSGKNTSGYTFGVNAAGAQMEGIVQVNSDSFDWDTKWYSASKRGKGYWTAELAIPFKSFRFPKDLQQWGINFIRNDMSNNCFSTWNQVPIQFFGANLNCLGKIILADGAPRVKSNNAFIPYVSAKMDQDENKNFTSTLNAGIDAKIALSSSLNLDATINPDFSQVDVDRQIINLERFSVLLPERRTFFLENSDLFSNIGLSDAATPFVSRKIGLTDDGRIVPIIAGLRLTGNVNPSLRIGLMNIQSAKKYGQLPQNYTVAAFDHKIFQRSNIRGIFTNRQEIASNNGKQNNDQSFNRVAGTELNLLSNNTKFNGRLGYYQSFNPNNLRSSGFGLASIGYTDPKLNISAGWNQVNTNFIADVGFTPRLYNYDAARDTTVRIGYNNYNAGVDYSLYPKSKKILNSLTYSIKANQYYTTSNKFIEFDGLTSLDFLFANRSEAFASWSQSSVNLPFATTIFAETGSLRKAKYDFGFFTIKYLSNFLRPFSWGISVDHGGYYNGRRTSFTGNIKYRRQPWGNFGVDFTYNDITLNGINIHPFIVSPTIEFAFTNNLFWTTFLQYNTQVRNFNLNSRIQWRFKPASDIYLVYADNYFTNGFITKGRSLVFKISYWLN
ncbi:MAG: carbohydrate binding family 9 domain-containing protein [Bacteroidetes bacterium]|nr:carbohydrate binding family 9 domain-containing protein [Bacteroidota bacterium]